MENAENTKTFKCWKCQQELPLTEKCGKKKICYKCNFKLVKDWKQKNPEAWRIYVRKQYLKKKDDKAKNCAKWREKHGEHYREYQAKYQRQRLLDPCKRIQHACRTSVMAAKVAILNTKRRRHRCKEKHEIEEAVIFHLPKFLDDGIKREFSHIIPLKFLVPFLIELKYDRLKIIQIANDIKNLDVIPSKINKRMYDIITEDSLRIAQFLQTKYDFRGLLKELKKIMEMQKKYQSSLAHADPEWIKKIISETEKGEN